MSDPQPNNPLHGITLEQVVTRLEKRYGWEYLARNININCFKSNPSVKSSLKFLRRTPWARDKVEALYVAAFANSPLEVSVAATETAPVAQGDTYSDATPAASSAKSPITFTSVKAAGPWAKGMAKISTKDS